MVVRASALCDDAGMHSQPGLVVVLCIVAGCTEPNPAADGGGDSSTGSDATTTGATMTGATMTGATMTDATTTDVTTTDADETIGDPTTEESSATTLDTSTGEPACPIGTHLCLDAVPDGWFGPVALLEFPTSEPPGACADPFAIESIVAYDDLVAPDAECTCDCDAPLGAGCDIELVVDTTAGCGSPTDDWNIPLNSCVGAVAGAPGSYWQATATPPDGTCNENATENVVEAEFAARLQLCTQSRPSPGVCDGGDLCAPVPVSPFEDRVCIYAEGEFECPRDSDYAVHRLVYRDILDTRGCSTCTCGIEGECNGNVFLFGVNDCGEAPVGGVTIDGACVQVNLGVTAGELSASFEVDATCEPSGGTFEGTAVGSEPVTVCCHQ